MNIVSVCQFPKFWVYILYCVNDSFYTGYTTHLNRRYQAHVQGVAAKYTRSYPPVYLAQSWPIYGEKHDAMRIERFIKKLDKGQKQTVIADPLKLEKMYNGL